MRPRTTRLLALTMAFLLAGCACTAVGCANELRLHLSADLVPGNAYDVTLCFDDACHSVTLEAPNATTGATSGPVWLWTHDDTVVIELGGGPFRSSHEVRFDLLDEDGEVLARFDDVIELVQSRPNGPFCEPTCWSADIGMEPPATP